MSDILQPLLVILVGGLFAPLLTQLLEKGYAGISGREEPDKPRPSEDKKTKRRKWLRFFAVAISIQLLLFALFFLMSKWMYFDSNYFRTNERELIRKGLKKDKDYVIPKMTIRIYSESQKGIPMDSSHCAGNSVNYCSLVSISYEIVALRDFNAETIFQEYYESMYATHVLKEPGSEIESPDINPNKTLSKFDVNISMKKFERRTITTRADYLYDTLPEKRQFFDKWFDGKKFDMFYYPNKEDDVIGEVEFQVISRSLSFNTPDQSDAILKDGSGKATPVTPQLVVSNGDCMNFNLLTAKIPALGNTESFGIKWTWK